MGLRNVVQCERRWDSAHVTRQGAFGGSTIAFWRVLFFLLFLFPTTVKAQFIGYTAPQTVTLTVFNSTACTGSSQVVTVPNLGQSAHYVMFQGSLISSLNIKLMGSNNASTFFDISEIATGGGNQSGLINGNGYYAVVQVSVTCNVGGSITAFYSGLSTTPGQLFGAQLTSQLVKAIAFGQAANTSFNTAVIRSPFGNSLGALFFKYAAAGPSGSSITVSCSADENATFSITLQSFSISTVNTQQIFQVSSSSCPFYVVTYNSGGASATNFTAFYSFLEPGQSSGAGASTIASQSANGAILSVSPGNWSVTNNPAAGSQATASRAAGATGVRHVANCITFSSASTTAPALTALTVNLRDGASGLGTILWTQQIAISATTGQNTPPNQVCGLNIIGSPATNMTLEWSAALANLSEAVSLSGYDVGP